MKHVFLRWFTNQVFRSLSHRIELTVDYLEKVGERGSVERALEEDLKKLDSWVYGSNVRKETVLEYQARYAEIKQKRLPK